MTKLPLILSVIAAVTVASVVIWRAEATPLTAAGESFAVLKSYSTVHKAGCMFGTRRCPAGTKWVCAHPAPKKKTCICRPC